MDDYRRHRMSMLWVQKQEPVKETHSVLGPFFREFIGESGTRYKVRANGDVEITRVLRHEDLELPN